MMKTIIYAAALIVLLAANVMAKRLAPKEVPPIATEETVFTVPHFPEGDRIQNGGLIEARDPKTKKLLWQVQIYKTEYDKSLEKDVQDVFIKSLTLDKVHNLLIMSDEKSRVFVLNLATKKVTQIQTNVISATLKVWDKNRSEQTVYQLLPEGRKILDALVAGKPDTDIKGGVNLDPSAVLTVNNIEYWIEPDEIILSGNEGTKVWEKNGIRNDLIQHSNKLNE